jgi:hypothetical protein
MNMTDSEARTVLKKHAAAYGDTKHEPARWVVEALQDAVSQQTMLLKNALWKACGDDEQMVNDYIDSQR